MLGVSSLCGLVLGTFLVYSGASEPIPVGNHEPQATSLARNINSKNVRYSSNDATHISRGAKELEIDIMERKEKSKLRLVWPPVVIQQTALGYIRDDTGNNYPRDIGRSSKFSNGRIMFQFGDTFSHSWNGTYLGNTDNTFSILKNELNPTLSEYQTRGNAKAPGEAIVAPMLMKNQHENDTATTTIKLWSFSGIVEYKSSPNAVFGWTFYQKRELNKISDIDGQYIYTGIAKVVSEHRNGQVLVIREHTVNDPLELFVPGQPLFGDLCAVSHGKFIYLYGHLNAKSNDVGIARAPLETANLAHTYEFWDGLSWTKKINKTAAVMTGMEHGQVFETDVFGQYSGYKWAFFGCNSFGDSKGAFGRARALEGPWEIVTLDMTTYALITDPSDFRYCMYPHPWAFDMKKGDLMVSWSEGGVNGGVLAAKIRFQMTLDGVEGHELLK